MPTVIEINRIPIICNFLIQYEKDHNNYAANEKFREFVVPLVLKGNNLTPFLSNIHDTNPQMPVLILPD